MPFDSRDYVVRFRPIQRAGGGRGGDGGAVNIRPIQRAGRVGGGGGSADPIIQSVRGGCSPLSANSAASGGCSNKSDWIGFGVQMGSDLFN